MRPVERLQPSRRRQRLTFAAAAVTVVAILSQLSCASRSDSTVTAATPSHLPMTRPAECLATVKGMGGQGTFAALSGGRILYSRSDGRAGRAGGFFSVSSDGGLTWSGFWQGVDANGEALGEVPGSLMTLHGGALGYAARSRAGRGTDSAILFWRSEDEGKSWSMPVRVSEAALHGVSKSNDVLVRTSSGRIILPVYGYMPQARDLEWGAARSRRTTGGLRDGAWMYAGEHPFDAAFFWSYVYYSDDDGVTWRPSRSGMIFIWDSETMSHLGTTEPTIAEVEPRKLLMLLRTMTGRLYKSWSFDDGETWTAPTATPLATSNASAKLKRVPATGDLVVVWNQQSEEEIRKGLGRSRLSSAISRAKGAIWEFYQNVDSVLSGARVEPGPIRFTRPEGLVHHPLLPAPERDPDSIVDLPTDFDLGARSHPAVFFHADRVLISYGRYGDERGTLKVLPLVWLYGGDAKNLEPREDFRRLFPLP